MFVLFVFYMCVIISCLVMLMFSVYVLFGALLFVTLGGAFDRQNKVVLKFEGGLGRNC